MSAHIRLVTAALLALGFAPFGTAAPTPAAGTVLLLDNHQVMEGAVERVGDQYRVARDGGETLVPANRVLAVCPDLGAAYQFLCDRADPKDAAARLRLAHWCDANGLRAQAAAEAQAAVELRPRSAEARNLLTMLRNKAAAPAPTAVTVKPASPPAPQALADTIDCGAEAFKRFTTKVQPVLMNTCAGCHAGEADGKFRLERVFADGLNSQKAAQHNLAAALAQIDRSKPLASPLLQHATAAHGGAAVPPLRDRSVAPYRQLEDWVRLVTMDSTPAPAPVAPAVVPTSFEPGAAAAPEAGPKSDFGAGNPPPKETPKDPFDPAEFNRQHHPGGAPPAGPPMSPSESPPGPKP
jgi:hypothetical protein